ncbi:uncharacterized protein prr36b [Nerophis ophidion]|uniref:uncharacterized protein prr36b n=1 Tax=Nerophis ophidion TaxID=159077 RepID=UPI002ADFFC76|nr:uncharacterized protein prr36b [Nerophis ophidion]XP_061741388.1 uncharacterized protein prr36b [Nerophis ophidion]XP_061741389.1 uncharacterized protein prr36b [Nerophis ophidion]XP_061741390.1 uncharacterized protein prr36b [Nerophis ophidion]
MKPDGVISASLEPMETLESSPVNDAALGTEQEPIQAAIAVEEEMAKEPVDVVQPLPEKVKESPAAKTSGDLKAKTTNKTTLKTKAGTTNTTKNTPGSRPNTAQSRLSNGVSKPQTNGVTRKTTSGLDKKSTPTSAAPKKPTTIAGAPASRSTVKVSERKVASPATNGPKSAMGTAAMKKATSTTVNGVKTGTAAAAKKPPAPKPASAAPTKSATAAKTDKALVSKTTRPTTGTAASRPSTGSTRPPPSSTTRSSPATPKPATPRASNAASRSTSSTPSAVKIPASQTSRATTPAKKDVLKPATPAAKKLAKPESPKPTSKSDITAKKPSKVADIKTANRPKTQENKSMPSKDASKTSASKTVATKNSSAKKTVGSSTPTPVKRGPKAEAAAETGKEIAAAVAAAAAIATAAATIAVSDEPQPPVEAAGVASLDTAEQISSQTPLSFAVQETSSEPTPEPSPEVHEILIETAELIQEPTPELMQEPTSESLRQQTSEPIRQPSPEPMQQPTPEPVVETKPVTLQEEQTQHMREPTPDFVREPSPEPMREPTPYIVREPTPEPERESTPEPCREPTPDLQQQLVSEFMEELTPEPVQELSPEPLREATPELLYEPTPETQHGYTPEPAQDKFPETMHDSMPEPTREFTPPPKEEEYLDYAHEMSPEVPHEPSFDPSVEPQLGAAFGQEAGSKFQLPQQPNLFQFEQSANESVPSLGTTVMSPPCSPPGTVSPVGESQSSSALLNMHVQPDPWNTNLGDDAPQEPHGMMNFATEKYNEQVETWETRRDDDEEEEAEAEEEEQENMFTTIVPSTEKFTMAEPQLLGALPIEGFTSRDMLSPREKEVAVEKADEEINEDDDEDEEDEEQRRLGHQLSSMITDMSTSQPSEEFHIRPSAFSGSSGWHCDDLLSGMDSEDLSSCTSSRQHGVSDLSSTQHTALLEGTQSSDALIDSSLRGSEGDGNLMGSPNVETLANEEDEDEEDEREDEMDLSSERAEEHKVFQPQEKGEDEEDEDVEMHSEGVTESCENAEEDDFNEDGHLDNLNQADSCVPPASSWGQTTPFCDTWAQPASLLSVSSPSPLSDHGAAESETPTQSPAQPGLDGSGPFLAPLSGQDCQQEQSFYETKSSDPEETQNMLAAQAVGMSQSSPLSGTALTAHSGSETSTPEDLRDYDSSSGVESRSDKQQTPVPAAVQPDMEQDLGIHLEKGDGEEEEAETLPADEVLGTGPPTAPASAPSSPTTSVDEASDTEGEMQINDPDAPVMMDESAGFESPTPTCNLPALDEDEEAVVIRAGDGEEDGGGATPQSANSVASYGFDCTTSNSNAHSMAESCGKSPGIFSLENEEQLPEEAKDPSLIKELNFPSAAAAAQAEDLLGRPVDLMPLGFQQDKEPSLDEHHYVFGGEITSHHLEEVDALEASHLLGPQESTNTDDNQPLYYSTISDKTDFLEGNV